MNNNLTTYYVVRHGQSEGNAHGEQVSKNVEGESPLTGLGKQQAKVIAEKLMNIPFDKIFTSHLTRAQQTAAIIAAKHGLQPVTVENIHERIFGSDPSQYTKEARAIIEGVNSKLNEDEVFTYRYCNDGESIKEAYTRFMTFLRKTSKQYPGKILLIIGHGNIMRWLLIKSGYATYKQLPPGSIANCEYIILETDGLDITIKGVYKSTEN